MPRVVGRPAVALARPPKLDEQARRPARRGRQLWWARGADPHVDQVRCGHDKCTAHVQLAPRRARVARRRRDNLGHQHHRSERAVRRDAVKPRARGRPDVTRALPLQQLAGEADVWARDAARLLDLRHCLVKAPPKLPHDVRDCERGGARHALTAVHQHVASRSKRRVDEFKALKQDRQQVLAGVVMQVKRLISQLLLEVLRACKADTVEHVRYAGPGQQLAVACDRLSADEQALRQHAAALALEEGQACPSLLRFAERTVLRLHAADVQQRQRRSREAQTRPVTSSKAPRRVARGRGAA
mmetsp:Transcript_20533/g.61186  ORF Transcript_20533/g.61186 Transcript_20533/m.61186 type:complete len:300 (+) Transcript_20533:773-1672(+)